MAEFLLILLVLVVLIPIWYVRRARKAGMFDREKRRRGRSR